jgi:hypothetical protein
MWSLNKACGLTSAAAGHAMPIANNSGMAIQ